MGCYLSVWKTRCRGLLLPEGLLIELGQMDHIEALRLQAAEKYVLGDLPQLLRDEFEEHFFECQECALDVKAAAGFVDNARVVCRFG
jgi:Putative zinc-finger